MYAGFTVQTYPCNVVVKIVRKKKKERETRRAFVYVLKKKSEVNFMIITIISIISVVSGTF